MALQTTALQETTGWESLLQVSLACGKQRIILTGNIHDRFWDGAAAVRLEEWLAHHLGTMGYEQVLQYDIVAGTETLRGAALGAPPPVTGRDARTPDPRRETPVPNNRTEGRPTSERPDPSPLRARADRSLDADLHGLLRVLQDASAPPTALIIRHADMLVAHDRLHTDVDRRHALLVRQLSDAAARGLRSRDGVPLNNVVVLLYTQEGLIPVSLYQHDPCARLIHVAVPSFDQRLAFFTQAQQNFYESPTPVASPSATVSLERLARLTDGHRLEELAQLVALSRWERLPRSQEGVDTLLRLFRHGRHADPWDAVTAPDLQGAFATLTGGGGESDRRGLHGQDEAMTQVCDALYRGKVGMSRLIGASPTRPRMSLMFVGPTGVGKTLSARRIARFLFGDEGTCVIFDMSEYRLEHNVARLVGSPPGYVGSDQGGQLTNKVRDRAFLVVVFDELEKAHPEVLNIFLQILDRGCLTDGKGETVYLSECVLIFTSNIGATEAKGQPFATRKELEDFFRLAVERYFVQELGRPELLGRIGNENIVVFNPITDLDIKRAIVEEELDTLARTLSHQYPGFSFSYTPDVPAYFLAGERFDELGARGLTKIIESLVGTEMAKCVINNHPGRYILRVHGETVVLQEDWQA